ncbi:hypothetical protein RRG08_055305 [Elysia crispata]|uniref:Uncharacterized protein n=1 Tax=Elysia crispata TaxID=231223 RepID=A0AAE1AQE1_9GAST|nr:hypothetical protein RRG08_055305 [Elysia crispata]
MWSHRAQPALTRPISCQQSEVYPFLLTWICCSPNPTTLAAPASCAASREDSAVRPTTSQTDAPVAACDPRPVQYCFNGDSFKLI